MSHSALVCNMVKHLPIQGGCSLKKDTVLESKQKTRERSGKRKRKGEIREKEKSGGGARKREEKEEEQEEEEEKKGRVIERVVGENF